MEPDASTRQPVRFLHLTCADVNCAQSILGKAWFKRQDREWQFTRWWQPASWRTSAMSNKYVLLRRGRSVRMKWHMWDDPELRPDGTRNRRVTVGAATGSERLFCSRCAVHIHVNVDRLVRAAEAHPGHSKSGWRQMDEALVAYVADRGEVLYRLDRHAEELAHRDRKARRRAEDDPQARSRNGNALGLGGRHLAGANPREVR